MRRSVTFRLDPESSRILAELQRRANGSATRAIKQALRAQYEAMALRSGPTAWETYRTLKIPKGRGPTRDRARHVSKLWKEILLAKHRAGTL
jgi:hypothetical protein